MYNIYKKYFFNHWYYFIIFIIISVLYIVNGYATIATGDDWALRSILADKGIYGTLIMSYPLSYMISHLYDYFPTIQWYSSLLALVLGMNFYFISLYIAKIDSLIQKLILFILALLWMTFLWFNMSITVLTVTTIVVAAGLIQKNIRLSFFAIEIRYAHYSIAILYCLLLHFKRQTSFQQKREYDFHCIDCTDSLFSFY